MGNNTTPLHTLKCMGVVGTGHFVLFTKRDALGTAKTAVSVSVGCLAG